MQTFLPYISFRKTAKCLDDKRLGKQRVEAMQILNALSNPNNRWKNHPAVRMWKGFEKCLCSYANDIMLEWERRGFENNMEYYNVRWLGKPPPWLGNPRLHFSHRCNLVRKFPEHYGYIWNNVDPAIPYWWPVKLKSKKLQAELDSFWNLISDEFILELLQI